MNAKKKNVEIERKFLVKNQGKLRLPTGGRILQGYLSEKPTVRVRIQLASESFLTIKGPGTLERSEFEYRIPYEDAVDLLKLCPTQILKYRYPVNVGGKMWEVDEFDGPLKGLWLAEIELSHKDEEFEMPDWAGKEVTEDPRYSNVNLARLGIPESSRESG